MSANAPVHPEISAEEWALIMELLERNRAELLVEIRHTDTHAFRAGLRRRVDAIDALLAKLEAMRAAKS